MMILTMLAVVMLPYWWGYRREISWILFPQPLFSLPLLLLKTFSHKIYEGSCFCSACAIEFQYMAVDVCVERFCFKIRKIFRRAGHWPMPTARASSSLGVSSRLTTCDGFNFGPIWVELLYVGPLGQYWVTFW